MKIGYRMNGRRTEYVAQLPGHGGVDWGYTPHIHGKRGMDVPIPLSVYWQRRFRRDEERGGRVARFLEVEG